MEVGQNLSFKTKLIGLCLLMSGVSVLIGVISYQGIQRVQQSYTKITEGSMPNQNLLNNMYLSYKSVRINLRTLGLPGLSRAEGERISILVTKNIEEYEVIDKAYNDIPFVEGEQALYDIIKKDWLAFKAIGLKALDLYKTGKPEDQEALLKIFNGDCPKQAEMFDAAMTNIKDFHFKNSTKFVAESKQISESTNLLISIIAIFGVVIGNVIGVLFSSSIAKKISTIGNNLSLGASEVLNTSQKMSTNSESLSQATTEQAASLEETAASLEEITAMISKASESANQAAASSALSQTKAEEGRSAVQKMLSSMEEINKSNQDIESQIEHSNEQMSGIVKVIQEIGNKTKVINEIVFQTKLLSFNASVEAARAGEHGKGFAVVAEEVGNLAQMSGSAAKDISGMLESSVLEVEKIVNDTRSKVEEMIRQGKERVATGVEVANLCAESLNDIVSNVTVVSGLAKEISLASREQSLGVSEINKAMGQLDIVTQQNAATSQIVASAADELNSQAEALKLSVAELTISIEGRAA